MLNSKLFHCIITFSTLEAELSNRYIYLFLSMIYSLRQPSSRLPFGLLSFLSFFHFSLTLSPIFLSMSSTKTSVNYAQRGDGFWQASKCALSFFCAWFLPRVFFLCHWFRWSGDFSCIFFSLQSIFQAVFVTTMFSLASSRYKHRKHTYIIRMHTYELY